MPSRFADIVGDRAKLADLMLIDTDVIILARAIWALLTSEHSAELHDFGDRQAPGPVSSQLREPPEARQSCAAEMAVQHCGLTDEVMQGTEMTVGAFVQDRFVPEYVALKRSPSRAFYRTILKHILRPEEVDRMFSFRRKASSEALKAVPGWPYLSNVRLCDASPPPCKGEDGASYIPHMSDCVKMLYWR